MGKNLEGNSYLPILMCYPDIHLEGPKESTKSSVRAAGLQDEI
jgi:hypothetical protein